jgi:hypothetical protein
LTKWEECPRRAQYDIIQKLCPACFKGTLVGAWQQPQICDTCAEEQVTPEAIARGTRLHTLCEQYITGTANVPPELKYVAPTLKALRVDHRKGLTKIEVPLVFNDKWEPVSKFTKDAWLRTTLDVLSIEGEVAEVIDWKSGGIDKKTKEVKAQDKYTDQLSIYATAVLSAYPAVEIVTCLLLFIDAPKNNTVSVGGTASRKDLPRLQKKWAGRARGILSDTLFVPRPTYSCKLCPFTKAKGGPCVY